MTTEKLMHLHDDKGVSKHHDYTCCSICGTHSRRHPRINPEDEYGPSGHYWNQPHRSTIKEQIYNVAIDRHGERHETKTEAIIRQFDDLQFAHLNRGKVLEIGCAPGSLLARLASEFRVVVGNDYCNEYEAEVRGISGCTNFRWGPFPDAFEDEPGEQFDCIIAMDVWEHLPDPVTAFLEAQRLLIKNGRLVLMMPMIFNAHILNLPEEEKKFDDKNWHPEHFTIFSQKYLIEVGEALFTLPTIFDRWQVGHEIVTYIK